MKRLAVALSIAAALALAPAAAEASTGTCPTKCTPAPTPPPGGWKCQQTHSCRPPKHPHCKPPKKHHRPPVTKPPVTPPHSRPIPPVKTAPKKVPAARLRLTSATVTPASVPAQLAYTGAPTDLVLLLEAAGVFGLAGSGLVWASGHKRKAQR